LKIDKQELFQWSLAHKDEQLELLKELAAIPAPSHREEKRVAFIRSWLKQQGAEGVYVDEALNVVLPFGCNSGDDITVYMAHTDVVFPDMDALPVCEAEGKLFAPGVGDDTANVVALMQCVKFLLEKNCRPKEPVLIVFNSCEEGLGNLKGVRQIMAEYNGRIRELVSFDCQYSDVYVRAVGSERWKVNVTTCGGHSYSAFGNANAIAYLAELVTKLYRQEIPQVEGRKVTYNVGSISGGTSVNTIAQNAEILYEYRSDDADCLKFMRKQFLELVSAAQCPEASFEVACIGERPCGSDVPEVAHEKLICRSIEAITAATGSSPTRRSASTDANIPLSRGIPAVTFGLYMGGKMHTREEYVEIDSLETGLRIGLLMITSHFD